MSKTFRPYEPGQQLLLPAALQEWLPEDHPAYFISDVVDQLDLSAITVRYQGEDRGGPPYHPRMMVKALLYGYCTGVASCRRIAQRLHEDIAFRVLAANNTPDFGPCCRPRILAAGAGRRRRRLPGRYPRRRTSRTALPTGLGRRPCRPAWQSCRRPGPVPGVPEQGVVYVAQPPGGHSSQSPDHGRPSLAG